MQAVLLLVDPLDSSVVDIVSNLLLGKPEGDLSLGGLNGVGSVNQVASNIDGEVSTKGTRSSVVGVGGTDEFTSSNNGVLSLPNHGNDSSRGEVLAQSREEGARLEVIIV